MRIHITRTGDGSSTLFVPELKEHYHSINGAVQESEYVFIRTGLEVMKTSTICLLEVGFGTGLNALLTLRKAGNFDSIRYYAIEKFPLDWEQVEQMKYGVFLNLSTAEKETFRNMHQSPWNVPSAYGDNFTLYKIKTDLKDYQPSVLFDLVYFDAFAPAVQPELWEETVFKRLGQTMKPGSILVTYCAKGEVRRRLQRSGFSVERLPGPPGKREIIRATRLNTQNP